MRPRASGIGEADVLARHPHQPAGEVVGVLAGGEHAGQPVERGVGVALAHRLVEGGDEVEVLLPRLVVEQDLPLRHPRDRRGVDLAVAAGGLGGGHLEQVQGGAGVARGELGEAGERLVVDLDPQRAETQLAVVQGPAQQRHDVGLGERLQHHHPAARQQRRVQLERRVLGGRPHQHDVAPLDVGEEGVLLRLVEAVDLVDEDQRAPPPRLAQPGGVDHHRLDLLDPRGHRRERHELEVGLPRDDQGEGGLAAPRRPPEDERRHPVAADGLAEEAPLPHHRALPQHLVEGPRAHALGERGALAGARRGPAPGRGLSPGRRRGPWVPGLLPNEPAEHDARPPPQPPGEHSSQTRATGSAPPDCPRPIGVSC